MDKLIQMLQTRLKRQKEQVALTEVELSQAVQVRNSMEAAAAKK